MTRYRRIFPGLLLATSVAAQEPLRYPLDPLSRTEITATVGTLTANHRMGPTTRVGSMTLHEPTKADVLAGSAHGTPVPRLASVVLYDWSTGVTSTGIIDPLRRTIVRWSDLAPGDPPVFALAVARATEIAQRDARFREAMHRRGYADVSRLRVEPAVASDYQLPMRQSDRVTRAVVLDQDALDMGESRGLFAVTLWVNLTRGVLDSLRDSASVSVYARDRATHPARIEHTSGAPVAGAGEIAIRGTAIRWGRWRLRAGVDPRRGLELYDIGFVDGGRVRPILYRASISETIAPYGDPAFRSWYPMDEGDVGLAVYGMTSAVPGEDAPSGALFLPATFANDQGQVVDLPRAVAVFDRESDVQWRHAASAQRARELVVRGYCTADNYDYVFDWIFREDGSVRVQVAPTGIINAYPSSEHDGASTASLAQSISRHRVGMGTMGPLHQHFFSYRLDFDIDGPQHNRVVALRPGPLPVSADNPTGEWFAVRPRTIHTEQEALEDSGAPSPRWWLVVSTRDTNALGQPTGYAIVPGENTPPYESPTSPPRRRAQFVAHELWVTPYRPDEMYAAGDVPSHDTTAQGLPRWTAANRSVDDGDIVVWYTLGLTHLPRTEDWPLMPTYPVGFRLLPAGFFSHDPALDTARQRGGRSAIAAK